jgi:7-carboxy-7-deazaguanine synthase
LSAKASAWRGVARPGAGELLVSEIFGPTLQGEGPSAGQAAAFVRLGGCNLSCCWCDTAYTWDQARYHLADELSVRRTEDVAEEVLALGPRLVVLTGGEPALQAPEALRLTQLVQPAGCNVEIETSGTLPLGSLADTARLVVVSPKLSSAGMRPEARIRWHVLRGLSVLSNTVFKFVVADPAELDEVDVIVGRLTLPPPRVWVMPEATDLDTLLQRMACLAGPVAERGWSLSSRLQVLIWGNRRGC